MIKVERPLRFAFFLLIALGVVSIIIFGLIRLITGPSIIQQSGELVIPVGVPAISVWEEAVAQGFTARTLPWRYHAWRQDAANSLQVGTYQLTVGEKVSDVIERLTGGNDPDQLTLTFPEGFTIQQMAARTAGGGIGTEDEFIQVATPSLYADQFTFLNELPPGRDLEGYLFPDTYHVFVDDTPSDVIQRMLTNFNEKFSADLFRDARAAGRSFDEIVIMASIIEREVISDEDMALVSGVLWQRYDDGVGLAADATVRYALDKWDAPLTAVDLQVDSPYNTRRFRGLPPGPISNPGLRALIAAVRPEETDFYYYLSAPSGETIFSRTLDEHNANKARYLR